MTRRRPFIALALAEALSISGTRLSSIAIPWLVLTETGSPVLTGLVAMAEMLPSVLARALGGPLIDRVGARRIAIVGDLASAAVLALVPILHLAGGLDISLLVPIVFALGVLRGPTDAAKMALVPHVAQLTEVPLERVTGVVGMIERLGSTVGAAAAGGLVALIGPAEALWINALAFVLSAVVAIVGFSATARQNAPASFSLALYRRELAEGWRFMRADAVLVGIVLMLAVTNLLDQAYGAVLAPVWAERSGQGAALLGLTFAVFTAASIGGAAIATLLGERLPRLLVYALAFLLTGLPRFIVLAVDVPLPGVFVVLALAGFASGFLNPILGAVIFERIPKPLLGRVSSLTTALGFGLMPFGGLLAGVLIERIGLSGALLACGLVYFAATLLPLTNRSFRAFGRRPAASAGHPE